MIIDIVQRYGSVFLLFCVFPFGVQRLASEAERLQREHLWQDGIKVNTTQHT